MRASLVMLMIVASAFMSTDCSVGSQLPDCKRDSDCDALSACIFPIGDCEATGKCSPGGCTGTRVYCGCGAVVFACDSPPSYATGPTSGENPWEGGNCQPDGGLGENQSRSGLMRTAALP
jgi:hypothetical protein